MVDTHSSDGGSPQGKRKTAKRVTQKPMKEPSVPGPGETEAAEKISTKAKDKVRKLASNLGFKARKSRISRENTGPTSHRKCFGYFADLAKWSLGSTLEEHISSEMVQMRAFFEMGLPGRKENTAEHVKL